MSFKDYDPKLFEAKRVLCNVTAEELGKRCFLTKQTIRNIELGNINKKSTILLIGLTLDDLAYELDIMDSFKELELLYVWSTQMRPLVKVFAEKVKSKK